LRELKQGTLLSESATAVAKHGEIIETTPSTGRVDGAVAAVVVAPTELARRNTGAITLYLATTSTSFGSSAREQRQHHFLHPNVMGTCRSKSGTVIEEVKERETAGTSGKLFLIYFTRLYTSSNYITNFVL
jgi:hypothetical protein